LAGAGEIEVDIYHYGDTTGDRQANFQARWAGTFLLDPAEIMRLSRHKALLFFIGALRYPILARKVRYYHECRWKGLWNVWRPVSDNVKPLPTPPEQEAQPLAA
jgi:type IV secretory pathway TraG/TraD family ATPase VirD4